MSSFWDEIAKQYGNAENRYRENLNAGLGMLNNKANMIQQGYANAMNNISQQGNLLGQSMNIPAQFAQLLANREDNALTRYMQQDQFTKNYALSKADTDSNIAYRIGSLANDAKKNKLNSDIFAFNMKNVIEETNRKTEERNSEQASATELLSGYTNPAIQLFIAGQRAKKISEKAILDMVRNDMWR